MVFFIQKDIKKNISGYIGMQRDLPRYELIFDENVMEGVYGVSLVNDPAIQIEAVRFSRVSECDFSNQDLPEDILDNIISKGEKIELNEWELIDVKEVDDEDVTNIDLSSIPNQSDESSQDNEIFKVRYEYTPSTTSANSREFCKRLAGSGLTFTKEDLVFSDANPGFGAGGSNTYNIFLFKGGVNCKHKWERKIFLRKNNKKLSVFEALKYIGSLDKKTASKVSLEQNPKEVSQIASSENNYWRLSSEIKDFKMSNEEKRILTCAVLLPEQNIYRNFDGEECNVFASAETIEKLQQNFFKNGYQSNSTIEHKEVIDGVFFFESWIVRNPKNDKANELGFDVPVGTWMMSMKVENQDIWNDYVKTGLIKGFSIDSRLGVQKKKNNYEKMNYSKVKEMVMAQILMEAQLNEFKIDDSLTVYAESLDNDMVVFDGEKNPLKDAEFVFEGKAYKTDSEGVIVSIEDVEVEQQDMAEDTPQTETPDTAKLQEELDMANKRIQELEVENQTLKAELVTIKDEAVKLANQPKVEGINLKNVETDLKPSSTLEVIRKALKK